MSAYLEHRLRRAGIEAPKTVCIAASRDSWVFKDIAGDLEWTYPGAQVCEPAEASRSCTLAIVPFFLDEHPKTRRQRELAEVLRLAPMHVGFFEMRKRRLVIVPRKGVSRYLTRTRLERILGVAMDLPERIVRGGRRRLTALFTSRDEPR